MLGNVCRMLRGHTPSNTLAERFPGDQICFESEVKLKQHKNRADN